MSVAEVSEVGARLDAVLTFDTVGQDTESNEPERTWHIVPGRGIDFRWVARQYFVAGLACQRVDILYCQPAKQIWSCQNMLGGADAISIAAAVGYPRSSRFLPWRLRSGRSRQFRRAQWFKLLRETWRPVPQGAAGATGPPAGCQSVNWRHAGGTELPR